MMKKTIVCFLAVIIIFTVTAEAGLISLIDLGDYLLSQYSWDHLKDTAALTVGWWSIKTAVSGLLKWSDLKDTAKLKFVLNDLQSDLWAKFSIYDLIQTTRMKHRLTDLLDSVSSGISLSDLKSAVVDKFGGVFPSLNLLTWYDLKDSVAKTIKWNMLKSVVRKSINFLEIKTAAGGLIALLRMNSTGKGKFNLADLKDWVRANYKLVFLVDSILDFLQFDDLTTATQKDLTDNWGVIPMI